MKNKRFVALLMSMVSLVVFACVSCGGNDNDGEYGGSGENGVLNIRVWDGGYGIDWAQQVADAFGKEYGVKVTVKGSSLRTQLSAEMKTEESKNQKYDIFFTDLTVSQNLLVDLSDVYNYTNEGETRKIGDKFFSDIHTYYKNDDGTYYYMPWGIGIMNFTYNADIITPDMIPNTSDELIALCQKFKSENKYSFVFGNDTNYWDRAYSFWWSQYDGIEKYNLYFNGKLEKDGIYTSDILYSQGKLRALELCENLLSYNNGYTDPASSTTTFMTAQKNYFEEKSVMMLNGGWLENEMSELFPEGCPFTIDTMKYPMISSIIERLDTVNDDATLSQVIDYVDGKDGATVPAGVSAEDVAEIRKARNLCSTSVGHNAIIPKSGHNEENAKKFLKFLYSDRGINIYLKHSNGSTLMTKDNVYDAEWFDKLTRLQKSVLNILNVNDMSISTTPRTAFTTAGLNIRQIPTYLELLFCSQNANDRKTASEIWQYDIDYYTKNDGAGWNQLLLDAGV